MTRQTYEQLYSPTEEPQFDTQAGPRRNCWISNGDELFSTFGSRMSWGENMGVSKNRGTQNGWFIYGTPY